MGRRGRGGGVGMGGWWSGGVGGGGGIVGLRLEQFDELFVGFREGL